MVLKRFNLKATPLLLAALATVVLFPANTFAADDPTSTNAYRAKNGIYFTGGSGAACSLAANAFGSQPGAINGTVSAFVDAYGQYAFTVGKQYGIPYDAILGQAALESGWGKSTLTTQGYNFFGIKADPSWTGPTITMRTAEQHTDGSVYYKDSAFRQYANAQEGFVGYAQYIHGNSRYATALTYPQDPFKYIEAVAKAGYASDISYASKVETAIRSVQAYIASKNLFPPSSQVVPDVSPPATTTNSWSASDCNQASGQIANVINVAKAELAKHPVEYDQNVLAYTTGRQEAWCADFVSWVFKQGGMPFTGGGAGGWQIPSVLSMQAWFKNGTAGSKYFAVGQGTPQPGDVAFYIGSQTPDGGSTEHVNVVISVDTTSNTMVTIGGNESNAVRSSTLPIVLGKQSLVGFGRMGG